MTNYLYRDLFDMGVLFWRKLESYINHASKDNSVIGRAWDTGAVLAGDVVVNNIRYLLEQAEKRAGSPYQPISAQEVGSYLYNEIFKLGVWCFNSALEDGVTEVSFPVRRAFSAGNQAVYMLAAKRLRNLLLRAEARDAMKEKEGNGRGS